MTCYVKRVRKTSFVYWHEYYLGTSVRLVDQMGTKIPKINSVIFERRKEDFDAYKLEKWLIICPNNSKTITGLLELETNFVQHDTVEKYQYCMQRL
jgi:hypothetical protein